MPNYSPGILLAWNIAAQEAIDDRHEFIEREHLFSALSKLKVEFAGHYQNAIPDGEKTQNSLKDEVELVADCFHQQALKLDLAYAKLKYFLGEGTVSEMQRKTVHRSESCRWAFDNACRYARWGSPQCIHLLAGLLDKPGVKVAQAIVFAGGDLQTFQQTVLHAMPVVHRTELPQPEKNGDGILDRYGIDLTQLAREGKIEPLIGRKKELIRLVRTLSRKTKNNPILLGEPGVGKTALVRFLAKQIIDGVVPTALQGKRIIELSLSALVAGTKYRGEFEDRLTCLMEEVRLQSNVILFLDEIHTMVSSGGGEGGLNAANILKPALGGSDFHCIGATTLSEYHKYFEKDLALARRFQPLLVAPPTEEETLSILNGLLESYENHHGVKIMESALKGAVEFSCRYLPSRQLPDKALDLLDEACARAKIGTQGFQIVAEADEIQPTVTLDVIARVVADWIGIPSERLTSNGCRKLQGMAEALSARVFGQSDAIEKVTRIVTMSRAGLRDPNRPIGVFLFVGSTGVGKTELCRVIADFLFGSDDEMIRLDMSEYQEPHSIARLLGAPPGYVGYGDEGQLTGKLRMKPYSLVLLDEMEKAHPEICDVFLQLFDEGRLTDSLGRQIDAKNSIFIMTSNALTDAKPFIGFANSTKHGESEIDDGIIEGLLKIFPSEFINRIDEIVPFHPLSITDIRRIGERILIRVSESISKHGIDLVFDDEVLDFIAKSGFDPINGARAIARVIDRLVSGPISELLVAGKIRSGDRLCAVLNEGNLLFVPSIKQN